MCAHCQHILSVSGTGAGRALLAGAKAPAPLPEPLVLSVTIPDANAGERAHGAVRDERDTRFGRLSLNRSSASRTATSTSPRARPRQHRHGHRAVFAEFIAERVRWCLQKSACVQQPLGKCIDQTVKSAAGLRRFSASGRLFPVFHVCSTCEPKPEIVSFQSCS